jgi:hypothetical protein
MQLNPELEGSTKGGVNMKIIPQLPKNFFIILLVGVGGYLLYRNIHRN